MPVTFRCHLSAASTPLAHAWEHTVGSDHALLALRADWQQQLRRCHEELGFRHVLLHQLGTERLPVEGTHATVDAWVVRKGRSVTAFLTNHAQPRPAIATELVRIELTNAPRPRSAYVERIDEDHANLRRSWQEMGAPEYLSRIQVEQLEAMSQVTREPVEVRYQENAVELDVDLPPHGLASVTIEFGSAPPVHGSVP
jgi:beta-xylosidase